MASRGPFQPKLFYNSESTQRIKKDKKRNNTQETIQIIPTAFLEIFNAQYHITNP